MSRFRGQAIKDVDIVNREDYGSMMVYAVAQRERVLELEEALQELVILSERNTSHNNYKGLHFHMVVTKCRALLEAKEGE